MGVDYFLFACSRVTFVSRFDSSPANEKMQRRFFVNAKLLRKAADSFSGSTTFQLNLSEFPAEAVKQAFRFLVNFSAHIKRRE